MYLNCLLLSVFVVNFMKVYESRPKGAQFVMFMDLLSGPLGGSTTDCKAVQGWEKLACAPTCFIHSMSVA